MPRSKKASGSKKSSVEELNPVFINTVEKEPRRLTILPVKHKDKGLLTFTVAVCSTDDTKKYSKTAGLNQCRDLQEHKLWNLVLDLPRTKEATGREVSKAITHFIHNPNAFAKTNSGFHLVRRALMGRNKKVNKALDNK